MDCIFAVDINIKFGYTKVGLTDMNLIYSYIFPSFEWREHVEHAQVVLT